MKNTQPTVKYLVHAFFPEAKWSEKDWAHLYYRLQFINQCQVKYEGSSCNDTTSKHGFHFICCGNFSSFLQL